MRARGALPLAGPVARVARAVGPPRAVPFAIYGALTLCSVGIAFARETSPIETVPWIPVPMLAGHGLSLLAGAVLALCTITLTRRLVRSWTTARALHALLRPTVLHADSLTLALLGIASAASEELFFRGLLVPVLGLVIPAIAFGFLHQVKGCARWMWAGWAAVMGLLFGALFLATGSLLGPIVAHAAINVMNLRFLRDTDVEPTKRRPLGGLLRRT